MADTQLVATTRRNLVDLEGTVVQIKPLARTARHGIPVTEFLLSQISPVIRPDGRSVMEEIVIPVQVFGGMATQISETMLPGDLVRVRGQLRQQKWTSATGQPQMRICIHPVSIEPAG